MLNRFRSCLDHVIDDWLTHLGEDSVDVKRFQTWAVSNNFFNPVWMGHWFQVYHNSGFKIVTIQLSFFLSFVFPFIVIITSVEKICQVELNYTAQLSFK